MRSTKPRYQKRHYEDIARVLRVRRAHNEADGSFSLDSRSAHAIAVYGATVTLDALTDAFAAMFAADNPLFRPAQFADAARGEE